MELAVFVVFGVLAYVLYVHREDEPKRREREKDFATFENLPNTIKALITENKKIEAIKAYRSMYGAGLKEANDIISSHLNRPS